MINDGAEELFCSFLFSIGLNVLQLLSELQIFTSGNTRARHRLTFSLHGRLDPASTALAAPLPVGTLGFT